MYLLAFKTKLMSNVLHVQALRDVVKQFNGSYSNFRELKHYFSQSKVILLAKM